MQRFIDLKWHTVPLKGELKRLENGKKTVPIFEANWKDKYHEKFNEKVTAIGGALTGEVSGIIAIDCDNAATYSMFRALDPGYDFVFESQGKGFEAGTIVYKYDQDLAESFSVNDNTIALDFYSNQGFIYLPTDANESKVPWIGMAELKEIPPVVKLAILGFKPQVVKTAPAAPLKNVITANCLNPLITKFTTTNKFMPGLFKIITPRAFREEPQYVTEGYLHPENVPQGRGSEYLSKISAILGADPSINHDLYVEAITKINSMWPDPMDVDHMDRTILTPMLDGKASIEGTPIWRYDEYWKNHSLTIHTKRDTLLDLGYDDNRGLYYYIDREAEVARSYDQEGALVTHINSVAVNPPKRAELIRALPLINVVSDASQPFGFMENSPDPLAKTLNTFRQTPELTVLHNPGLYATKYRKPEATLSYFKTLIPDDNARDYLLQFIKRKLTHFEYSPVILYFMGVQGSGKDTFVDILAKIMGHVSRPSVKEFLEIYNTWILDTYFVQLDEYGNQLTGVRDKEEALGKLKAYSGKQEVDVRAMRTNGYSYRHNATFIMTANKNPLMLEDKDRRISFFSTPTPLTEAYDDVPQFRDKIMSETVDFCYYLATQVPVMPRKDYMKPFASNDKHKLIADSMYPAARITYALKYHMFEYLKDLATDFGCNKFINNLNSHRLYSETMEEFYDQLTDYNGDIRALNKALKAEGITQSSTTLNGEKVYYYNIEFPESPFEETE
jgi:hypothetical protein